MTETSLLLVDDEEGIRKVLGLVLSDAGWKVKTAPNAEEALSLFRQERFPLVLTDIKMPGMNGLDLLKTLKTIDPETEVVLMTGHGDLELAIQGIKLDAADFVTKPIHQDTLDIALHRAQERWAMRRALQEHTEHLEDLVQQKTQELLDAERLAAVGQTVASLSHSIKNMASGLEGSLFLLRQGLDHNQEYLEQGWEMLEVNVRKLKELSLAMLRFAKPETVRLQQADPTLPARQVAELLEPRAKEMGLELILDCTEHLAQMNLDTNALHMCLLELVGNALDACAAAGFGPHRPGGKVRVKVRESSQDITYQVSDNGCGIPEESMPQLFDAFFSTKGDGGFGLGLMSVKKTVRAHGGDIHAQSIPGEGSTFVIIIPKNWDNKNP